MNKTALAIGLIGLMVLFTACSSGQNENSKHQGTNLAVTLQPSGSETEGVSGFHVEVYDQTQTNLLESQYVTLNTSHLPAGLVPDAGGAHDFSSVYFTLVPGTYHVEAQPMLSQNTQSTVCALAEADVTVLQSQSTTVTLMSQCSGSENGGADIVAALNNKPQILSVAYNPSQFVTTCQTLGVTVNAQDPDGDALTYNWSVTGAPSVPGPNTKSVGLDPSNGDYLDAGSDSGLDTAVFTWSMWVKRAETNHSNERALISYEGGTDADGAYSMQIDTDGGANNNKVQVGTGGVDHLMSTTAIEDTQWHHIAVTRNSTGTTNIYIDGVLDNQGTISTRTAFVGVLIGKGHSSYDTFYGDIDDVRIYNRALSAQEIVNNMNRELVGNESGLVAYWKLNDSLTDATSNGNDLAFGGSGTLTYSSDVPFLGLPYTHSAVQNVYTFTAYEPGEYTLQCQACDPSNCSLIYLPVYALGSQCQPQ